MRAFFLLSAVLIAPAASAETVRLLVSDARVDAATGHVTAELLAMNGDAAPAEFAAPPVLEAQVTSPDGVPLAISFRRSAGESGPLRLAPGGFGRLRYEADLPAGITGLVSLAFAGAPAIALTLADRPTALASAAPSVPAPSPAPPSAGSPRDNPFLANLSAYEPIYAIYGPGTDTSARIQISLKYRLFGARGNWLDGIHFAYTQRMFWDIEEASSPFRDVNYMPELFYLVPPKPVGERVALGGRIGARHESNGRDGDESRTLNTIYVQPEASIPVGGNTLTLGPRLWAYVGGQEGNEDIERYRGHTGLYAAFGRDDGLRLSLTSRLNFSSGKGAVDGVLSYPLTNMWASGPQLYLIAQGFTGYGESLLDYDRRQTRLRFGFGITR